MPAPEELTPAAVEALAELAAWAFAPEGRPAAPLAHRLRGDVSMNDYGENTPDRFACTTGRYPLTTADGLAVTGRGETLEAAVLQARVKVRALTSQAAAA